MRFSLITQHDLKRRTCEISLEDIQYPLVDAEIDDEVLSGTFVFLL